MTVSFNPLKANGQLFTHLPELDDLEVALSNANAADVLDALGIEDSFSVSPWPLPCFKALLIVARRKRLGHASRAIPVTEMREPGSMLLIDCRPRMRRSHGYGDPSPRRAREGRRTDRCHVLVLAEAMPRNSHHRRSQATARMSAVKCVSSACLSSNPPTDTFRQFCLPPS
jgi:hypothetical protein